MPGAVPRVVARMSAILAPGSDDLDEDRGDHRVRREEILEPDPAIFRGRDPYPREYVSLGAVGSFRDQRYVDVVIAPVRFDPTFRGLRVARTLTVTIAFDGDSGARSAGSPDPRLEDLYREMFANYAQGTTFRETSAPSTLLAPAAPDAAVRYRIRVRANGVIRLDFTRLSGTGFELQPLSSYKLTNRGVEVPIQVSDTNGNDQLDAGDWVQFYGQALDDEPKTALNTVIPGGTNIYELRDYSDENVYFLTAEVGARSRLALRNAPADLTAPATKFDAIAHVETDNTFRPLSDNDPWYWGPVSLSGSSRTQSVALPGLASSTDPARVIVRLRGRTEDPNTTSDHKSRILFLNSLTQALSQNNDDGTFDGRMVYTHDFTWTYPGSGPVLSSPAQVRIDSLSVSGSAGYTNEFFLDFVEIRYKRNFQAVGDALTFDVPDGDAEFLVTGLASATPEVWEITGRVGGSGVVAPVRITGATFGGAAGNFSVRFHMTQDPAIPDGTPRRFVVAGAGASAIPASADFTADTVSDLRNNANQADLIVIAHPTVLGGTATPVLNSLLAWKLANQGITSKVAMIQDVYDEFGDGLAGPQAIKNFLAFTLSTSPGEGWSGRKPAWVLLIGDGSFDSKYNDTTVPASNFVPTQILFKDDPAFGYYASDSILADVAGSDLVPDLVIGRVSTRTDAQTAVVLQKLLDYQQSPAAGTWKQNSMFVSDRGKNYNAVEAVEWEDTNAVGRSYLKIPPQTQVTLRYWTDYLCTQYCGFCPSADTACGATAREALRADIKQAVNAGASILQFTGHGNFNVWSDDAFFAQGWNGFFDVNALTNGGKLPWLIVHNCLSGGFEDNLDTTLGEDWLKKSGGGAVAVFAPSGLNDSYSGADVTDKLWGKLFGRTKERVMGNAVAEAMNFICGLGITQSCQNYVLLGDPTTRLVFPSVARATQLVATPGNAFVNLSWTASPTIGATYDVYRVLDFPNLTYTKLNPSPLTTTSFSDTTAINAKTYYYYVVALDAAGFESAWSNFNSDCAVGGPDCVKAIPFNPNPPSAPTGFTVTDTELGGKLVLTWSPNVESDFDHYTVLWGTSPGVHPFTGNALKSTTLTLTSLTNGVTYYIVLTATNTSGQTSNPTPEKTGVPTFVRGVRSPGFIANLKVDKSGTNAVLTWPAVATDIYGKPATVASYEVYRGTSATFIPGPGNKIGQPATPSFTDTGALAFANPNYHYLVRAVDGNGNFGGLGNQLPYGIDLITLSKTPDGLGGFTLGLSWAAVTTDFNGAPLPIHHYEVYGVNHPFTRADVRNGLVPLLGSPSTPSFSVTAPAASQYYSVLAVDARGNKSSF